MFMRGLQLTGSFGLGTSGWTNARIYQSGFTIHGWPLDGMTYHSLLQAVGEAGVPTWFVEAHAFKIHVELNQKGFGEWVLELHDVHCREQELQRRPDLLVCGPALEILNKDASGDVETKGRKWMHLYGVVSLAAWITAGDKAKGRRRHTWVGSIWLMKRMMLVISAAAVTHRTLLSALTVEGRRFLSALKMAA